MTDTVLATLSTLGFDTSQGVTLTGGDVDFYLALVAEFCTEFLNETANLQDISDISTLATQVHSLKGVLQTLGEARVAAKAECFEAKMRNGHLDIKKLDDLCRELHGFAKALQAAGLK